MNAVDLGKSRQEAADGLENGELDVLVAGGGIVGSGVARDAAMRGLRTGVVEQHDVAFGTSSRSSRLLHGGLRYLAQGRIALVYEASHEKRIVHRIAPHLASPLPFVFPTYRRSKWPLWQLRIGVKVYDLLCGGRNLGPSSSMTAADVTRRLPNPKADRLSGAVRYYDGLTNDARLAIDTLRSASAHGATVRNYTRLESAEPSANRWKCVLRDTLSDRTFTVTAGAVVNATGPWSQQVPHSSVRLRLTKGIHLVIAQEDLPVPDAVVMAQGDRIMFAIPWGERVILGTTDTDYDGSLEQIPVERDDVDYLLETANEAFPEARLDRTKILSSWAGLRPLIATGRGGPSDISRAHEIRMPEPGWLDVAGGKLTTYRRIGQQVVDRLVSYLGRKTPPCRTAEEVLLTAEAVEGVSSIVPPDVSAEAVRHYCANEWAVHLDDVMLRRAGWHYYQRNSREIAEHVAAWMAELYGWTHEETAAELARYEQSAGGPG